MIVIFIIGIIGSVIGYNMKGSMDEGRAYRCEHGSKQIHDLLTLEIANGTHINKVLDDVQGYIKQSGFVSNPAKLLKDGWGQEYIIQKIDDDDDFLVYSTKWYSYLQTKKNRDNERIQEDYPWAFRFEKEQ